MTSHPLALALLLAASVTVQPPVDSDVLEPSVQNEVDHALSRAPESPGCGSSDLLPFPTNGLTATEIAIRLVSTQCGDGHWRVGTNDVTKTACQILKSL